MEKLNYSNPNTVTNNNENESYELTREQIVFYLRKKKLTALQVKKESGQQLSEEEKMMEDKLKADLFSSVLRFGMKEAQKTFRKYRLDSEAYYDIQQEFALKFFEKLDDYNPLLSTPTTYYVRHFKEVISKYLSKYTVHLSQYDIKNSRLVTAAINYFEAHGIPWTEDMIANRTGLTPKVVHSTLRHRHNANYKSVDDEESKQLASRTPTPEEVCVTQERSKALYQEMTDSLTEEELSIFMLRVNLEGKKERSFEDIHKITGIPLKDIKSICNSAALKLGNNRKFCDALNQKKNKNYKIKTVSLQDNATTVLENQILEQFGYTN